MYHTNKNEFFVSSFQRSKVRFPNQAGVSLARFLLVSIISVGVAVSAITSLSRVMGTPSGLQGTRLTLDLRQALQLISRDVRQAAQCLGNTSCQPDTPFRQTVGVQLGVHLRGDSVQRPAAAIEINSTNDCVVFQLDRNRDGRMTSEEFSAYRRTVNSGVGVLEIWMGHSKPDCSSTGTQWSAITYPKLVNVTSFVVEDEVPVDRSVTRADTNLHRLRIQVRGELPGHPDVNASLENIIELAKTVTI